MSNPFESGYTKFFRAFFSSLVSTLLWTLNAAADVYIGWHVCKWIGLLP